MGYFQILACNSDLGTCCTDPALVLTLDTFRRMFYLIQIIVPILLIIAATVEFTRSVMDPERKNAMKRVKNLFLAGAIVFLLPVVMDVVLTLLPQTFSVSACWNEAKTVAESYRKNGSQYIPINDNEELTKIITNSNKYKKGGTSSSGAGGGSGSVQGILNGAEKVHTTYEQQGWAYYSSLGQLRWNDINYSTYNPSKKTCCATFVGSALYVGNVFSESEINKYNYNSQYGISELCKNNGWTKITSYSQLAAGDIVIMTSSSSGGAPGHVQIYAGNGTWYNAGSTKAIQRANPYASDASSRFLWAWRKP